MYPVNYFPSSDIVRNRVNENTYVLTICNFVQGYHQLSLATELQHLMTFINIFGRYVFLRGYP